MKESMHFKLQGKKKKSGSQSYSSLQTHQSIWEPWKTSSTTRFACPNFVSLFSFPCTSLRLEPSWEWNEQCRGTVRKTICVVNPAQPEAGSTRFIMGNPLVVRCFQPTSSGLRYLIAVCRPWYNRDAQRLLNFKCMKLISTLLNWHSVTVSDNPCLVWAACRFPMSWGERLICSRVELGSLCSTLEVSSWVLLWSCVIWVALDLKAATWEQAFYLLSLWQLPWLRVGIRSLWPLSTQAILWFSDEGRKRWVDHFLCIFSMPIGFLYLPHPPTSSISPAVANPFVLQGTFFLLEGPPSLLHWAELYAVQYSSGGVIQPTALT